MEGKRKASLASWPQPRCIWGQTPQRFRWRWDLDQHIAQARALSSHRKPAEEELGLTDQDPRPLPVKACPS